MADRVAETKKSIADAFKKPKSKDDKRDSMWDSFLSDAPAPLGKTITESVKRERKRAGVDE